MDITKDQIEYLVKTNLFDQDWYSQQYSDVINPNLSPLTDYLMFGSNAGRRPNRQFDPSWYRSAYPDIAMANIEPLVHYIFRGASEGRAPSPCFEAIYYSTRVGVKDVNSIAPLQHYLINYPRLSHMSSEYSDWVYNYDTLGKNDEKITFESIKNFSYLPLFSVLIPTYETPEIYLREAIDSVLNQYYPFFEICIVDDCSPSKTVRRVINEYKEIDKRIKSIFRSENGHISRATNDGLAIANGDYVVLLDHDDLLRRHALYKIAEVINQNKNLDIIYSDEDKIDLHGNRHSPYFKPDWNEQLLYSQNYICHLACYRTKILRDIGGFRSDFDGSQDYDLILRATRAVGSARIAHVPHILYHWRASPTSTANNSDAAKPYARNTAAAAVLEAARQLSDVLEIRPSPHPAFQELIFQTPPSEPRLSIIVASDDATSHQDTVRWLSKIEHLTPYHNREVLLVVSAARAAFLSAPAKAVGVRLVEFSGTIGQPTNRFSFFNAGARAANGEIFCFLTPAVLEGAPHWPADLLGTLHLPEVGLVGPSLYDNEGTLAGGAYFLSSEEIAVAQYHHLRPGHLGDFGHFGRAVLSQDVGAVSEVGLTIRSVDFGRLGGFDSLRFPHYAAVDLCLRMADHGRRVVWVPRAKLINSAPFPGLADVAATCQILDTKGGAERRRMQEIWAARLKDDPTGNPNLRTSGGRPHLAFPPAMKAIRQAGFVD